MLTKLRKALVSEYARSGYWTAGIVGAIAIVVTTPKWFALGFLCTGFIIALFFLVHIVRGN